MTSYTIKDHGTWVPYTPSPLPDWAVGIPGGFVPAFIKRESDGVDWYEYRKASNSFAEGAVLACTLHYPNHDREIVKSVSFDRELIFPVNQRLLEINGVPAGTPSVHDLFTEQMYDPATVTIYPAPAMMPIAVSLSDWRIALGLWTVTLPDGTTESRLKQVEDAIATQLAAGNPLAVVANTQVEYANVVVYSDILLIKDAFGFTEADCEECMWRAAQVAKKDYSGVWPLPVAPVVITASGTPA